jgi:Domain of unknown function (DUF1963)
MAPGNAPSVGAATRTILGRRSARLIAGRPRARGTRAATRRQGVLLGKRGDVVPAVTTGGSMGDERRAFERAARDSWQLLLQVDSDDAAGMMWVDSGMLYYWIRKDDLAARRFERVWCVMQYC